MLKRVLLLVLVTVFFTGCFTVKVDTPESYKKESAYERNKNQSKEAFKELGD